MIIGDVIHIFIRQRTAEKASPAPPPPHSAVQVQGGGGAVKNWFTWYMTPAELYFLISYNIMSQTVAGTCPSANFLYFSTVFAFKINLSSKSFARRWRIQAQCVILHVIVNWWIQTQCVILHVIVKLSTFVGFLQAI
jgi:hypothetical protein